MKQKIAILLAVLAVLLTACGNGTSSSSSSGTSQSAGEELSPREEDLNLFVSTLEEKHKNLYANISKEEFLAEKEKIAAALPEMSDSGFYYSLRHLLSLVGDAHTSLGYTDSNYKHLTALGFAVAPYSDGWYLLMLEEQNQQYLGYRLTAIEGVPIDQVFERAKTIMSYDNEVWAQRQFSNTINFLDALQYLGIAGPEAEGVTLTIQPASGGPEEKLAIQGMSEEEIMNSNILQVQRDTIPSTVPSGYYRFQNLGSDAFFIQYNTCQEDPELPMAEFITQAEGAISQGDYSKVILDLRYNTGGDSSIFEPMIAKLKEMKGERGFTVYTLIGGRTFSSGIINAVQTQRELDALLVGSPTGGSVNGYGELQSFTLKNTPIQVYYSTKYFELVPGYDKDSLYPDQEVEQTYSDYKTGQDPEVAWVLKQ